MRSPTSREPVKAMKRVRGSSTSASPMAPPGPGRKFTTPARQPRFEEEIDELRGDRRPPCWRV